MTSNFAACPLDAPVPTGASAVQPREAAPLRWDPRRSRMFAGWREPKDVADILDEHHYLGASKRGFAWGDEYGVMVFAKPTARNVPQEWLELVRWCLLDRSLNSGSRQWAQCVKSMRGKFPSTTTIVSYSDPSVGHTGALYRACNWWWAPTWHRLRPPPTGNGSWKDGAKQSVKDRWVFPLRRDKRRPALLVAKDESILRKRPEWRYREPGGVPFENLYDGQLDTRPTT